MVVAASAVIFRCRAGKKVLESRILIVMVSVKCQMSRRMPIPIILMLSIVPSQNAACPSTGWSDAWGTSAGAPIWAASAALINQYMQSQGKKPLGQVNPVLYRIFNGAPQYPAFHDITTGTISIILQRQITIWRVEWDRRMFIILRETW